MNRIIRRRMRARDFPWMSDPSAYFRDVTAHAVAGIARSARARQARHQRKWGLLAPVVDAPPQVESVEERTARYNAYVTQSIADRRSRAAADWWRARARIRALPRETAENLLAEWNARTDGGPAWGGDLLNFLDVRVPTAERVAELRAARAERAIIHRRVAEREHAWWVQHTTCPEANAGVVEILRLPNRHLRCIGCEATWTKASLPAAEADGTLRIVDCRLAIQETLPL
jgi:hypothetical protein